eukprot:m.93906 g.93906  ORF g.93906 m.93906 type:complete len:1288 (+) comp15107_c1_seq1:555-4418(+)
MAAVAAVASAAAGVPALGGAARALGVVARRLRSAMRSRTGGAAAAFAVAACAVAVARYQRRRARHGQRLQPRTGTAERDNTRQGEESKEKSASKGPRAKTAWQLLKLVWPTLRKTVGPRLLALAALHVLQTAVHDNAARLQGEIFRSVFTKDTNRFVRLFGRNVLYHFVVSVLLSTATYMTKTVQLQLFESLNSKLESLYFNALSFYKLVCVDQSVKSPEQVITDDVPNFCKLTASITTDVLKALCDGTYFTWRLAQATSPWWASGCWVYAISAVVVVRSVSPPFGKLQSIRLKLDEAVRMCLANMRSHAQAITAYGGESRELALLNSRFSSLTAHISKVFRIQWSFGMLEDFVVKYCASTVAMIIILGPFFGQSRATTRAANADVLAKMRYVVSVIIHQLTAIAGLALCLRKGMKLAGYAKRIGGLVSSLEDINKRAADSNEISVKEGSTIAFEDVTVTTPTGHTLLEHLNLKVEPGTNLLITGPNGAGKSSIFRCLGALWAPTHGCITKPTMAIDSGKEGLSGTVFYIPQKPFNVVGTLYEQMTYPEVTAAGLTESYLRELLRLVDLEYLMDSSADKVVKWEDALSLGETQRLAMARLFFHRPTFAILDECTSGVSVAMEARLYQLCVKYNITCITISHRPALMAFHDINLALDGKGGYDIVQCQRTADHSSQDYSLADDLGVATSEVRSSFEGLASSLSPLPVPEKQERSALDMARELLAILMPGGWRDSAIYRLGSLVAIVVARVALSDRIASLNGETVKLLLQNNQAGFKRLVGVSLVQCVASSVMAPLLLYVSRDLALLWRRRLFATSSGLAFRSKRFYQATHLAQMSDVDQRLAVDTEKVATELANTFPEVLKPIVDLGWFSMQAVGLLGVRNTAALYLYMFSGLGVLRLITPDFASLIEKKSDLQSAFRYVHTRLHNHCEAIAFFRGEQREKAVVHGHFEDLANHNRRMMSVHWLHDIFDDFIVKELPHIVTWAFSFLYVVRAAAVRGDSLWGNDLGGGLGHELRYLASAVSHIFIAFGDLLQLNTTMSELKGFVNRVLDMNDTLRGLSRCYVSSGQVSVAEHEQEGIVMDNVLIADPRGNSLAERLTLDVQPGNNLLVTGPNSSGKSALFRILGGLWPLRRGKLQIPASGVFLVPQIPYMPIGNLAQQMTYPATADDVEDNQPLQERLLEILQSVGLEHLLSREGGWATERTWSDVLSLGEQQRLGMARLLYHKPKFAVLDQCTDAVSVDVEERLYNLAMAGGSTLLTLTQRPGLAQMHTKMLQLLDGKGHWVLRDLK